MQGVQTIHAIVFAPFLPYLWKSRQNQQSKFLSYTRDKYSKFRFVYSISRMKMSMTSLLVSLVVRWGWSNFASLGQGSPKGERRCSPSSFISIFVSHIPSLCCQSTSRFPARPCRASTTAGRGSTYRWYWPGPPPSTSCRAPPTVP